MAKVSARNWIFQVQTGPNEWTEIGGLNTFELDKSEDGEDVDDTTFASQGYAESRAMQRGASCELEGFFDVNETDGKTQDIGQAAVDALAEKVDTESLGGFRFRHKRQTVWTVWPRAWVDPGSVEGGNNDNTAWSNTFRRSGRPTTSSVAA